MCSAYPISSSRFLTGMIECLVQSGTHSSKVCIWKIYLQWQLMNYLHNSRFELYLTDTDQSEIHSINSSVEPYWSSWTSAACYMLEMKHSIRQRTSRSSSTESRPLIWIHISNIIQYECTFHKYLPGYVPAGWKHVANLRSKQILIERYWFAYYEFVVLTSV
jgi:hypothetical protein